MKSIQSLLTKKFTNLEPCKRKGCWMAADYFGVPLLFVRSYFLSHRWVNKHPPPQATLVGISVQSLTRQQWICSTETMTWHIYSYRRSSGSMESSLSSNGWLPVKSYCGALWASVFYEVHSVIFRPFLYGHFYR